MKRFIKRSAAWILSAALILTAASCGNKLKNAESVYYEKQVLADLTQAADVGGRLPGISSDVCIIEDESVYDPALIQADHALLINEDTQEALYAKNSAEKIYPASLTKLMTALIVVEKVEDLSAKVTITAETFEGLTSGASLAGIKESSKYTVEDLLYALLVPSGNDAANALAIYTYGSVDGFVAQMNKRAQELGMLNTHFANPHGLHADDHYTTAYDLYLLTREAAKYPVIRSIGSSAKAEITCITDGAEDEKQSFTSTNSFLRQYSDVPPQVRISFAKTGYTVKAGRCLIMDVTDLSGQQYIAIIAHVETYDELYLRMYDLLDLIP